MSQDIVKEVIFISHSFLLGVAITFVYDWFLILRRIIKHNMFMISLEDLIFWIACAISVFGMLYKENNGTLRWFAVAGAFLGMLIYKKSISAIIVNVISGILNKIAAVLGRMAAVIFKPMKFLANKGKTGCDTLKSKGNDLGRYSKKKLTACKKVLKIILCKR